MKYPIYTKRALCALSAFLLGGLSSANAAITIHGSTTAYTETGDDWLTKGTNDIDSSGGLGTDGWLFFGDFDGVSENGQPFAQRVESLPSYVTAVAQGADFNSIADEYAGYGVIDDPLVLDGSNKVAGVALGTGGGAGSFRHVVSFTVSGLPINTIVRVGVLSGTEGSTNGRWDPTSIQLTDGVNTATVGDHATSQLALNPGGTNTGWVFFDIDADGTYQVLGSKRLATQGAGIGGLTFDSIILTTPIWQVDGIGDWSTPANWSSSVPNAASAEAIFSDALPLTVPVTATLDVAVTLGDLTLSSAQAITVGGAEILTF
ncbi:MAG: hypothetical protein ACSHX4_03405, partial [Opitutaceae bacterium]